MSRKLEKPRVGVGVMILKNHRVLLGKRNDDAKKASSELHGEGTWTMPGGKLDYQEKLVNAAYREVYEETGIKVKKSKLEIISVTDDIVYDNHFVTIGFLCRDFTGSTEVREPDEIVEWKWFKLSHVPRKIYPPSRKVLKNYLKKAGSIKM